MCLDLLLPQKIWTRTKIKDLMSVTTTMKKLLLSTNRGMAYGLNLLIIDLMNFAGKTTLCTQTYPLDEVRRWKHTGITCWYKHDRAPLTKLCTSQTHTFLTSHKETANSRPWLEKKKK